MTYRFGPFCLDTAAYRLNRDDQVLPVPPKVIDLLRLLVSQPSALVTKEAILAELWPDVAVTDNAITQVVSELRQALGDAAAAPLYIQTVPRRGYRFVGDVEEEAAAGQPGAVGSVNPPRRMALAVSDFQNVNDDSDVAWLAAGIAETLSNDLRALRDLVVIDRSGLPELARRAGLEAARAAKVDWLVVGGYQRVGDRLRMTARVIDVHTGQSISQAKADGLVVDAFDLQDRLVTQLLADLRIPVSETAAARIGTRETSSIEAYRAMTEGRLKLESLDPALLSEAISDFDRALTLDPRYALAYVGLAEARFWLYESSRMRNKPDRDELRFAIAHARRAAELDAGLGEAHASLAFFLTAAGQPVDAIEAGRRAVMLEPNEWRHRFRLAVASWGGDRIDSLDSVERQYPEFAYSYFTAAMVHVARGNLGAAADVLERGLSRQDTNQTANLRYPGSGLNWLLGMVRWALDEPRTAVREQFDLELTSRGNALYTTEYSMNAYDGLGFLAMEAGRPGDADALFARALAVYPDHPRSLIGRATACRALNETTRAGGLLSHADRSIQELAASGGRTGELGMARACQLVASGDSDEACRTLQSMLDAAPPGSTGWTLPIEPWLAAVRDTPACQGVLATLAARAR